MKDFAWVSGARLLAALSSDATSTFLSLRAQSLDSCFWASDSTALLFFSAAPAPNKSSQCAGISLGCFSFCCGSDGVAPPSSPSLELLEEVCMGDEWPMLVDNDYSASCLHYSSPTQQLWLRTDPVGAYPLWRCSLEDVIERGLVITSDYFLAHVLGCDDVTALPPGHIIQLDIIERKLAPTVSYRTQRSSWSASPLSTRAERALEMAVAAVNATHSAFDSQSLALEMDDSLAESQWLACAFEELKIPLRIRRRRPWKSRPALPTQTPLKGLTEYLMPYLLRSKHWSSRSMAVQAMTENWIMATTASGGVLASFEAGFRPRPIDIYLLRWFCANASATLWLPFADPPVATALHEILPDDRALVEAYRYLAATGRCRSAPERRMESPLQDHHVCLVDGFCVDEYRWYDSHEPHTLDERHSILTASMRHHFQRQTFVILSIAPAYIPRSLVHNHFCFLDEMAPEVQGKYVLLESLAERESKDSVVQGFVRLKNLADDHKIQTLSLVVPSPTDAPLDHASDWLRRFRLRLSIEFLRQSVSIVHMDTSSLFLRNPLPYLQSIQSMQYDVLQLKAGTLLGGFALFNPSPAAIQLLTDAMASDAIDIQHCRIYSLSSTEIMYFEQYVRATNPRPAIVIIEHALDDPSLLQHRLKRHELWRHSPPYLSFSNQPLPAENQCASSRQLLAERWRREDMVSLPGSAGMPPLVGFGTPLENAVVEGDDIEISVVLETMGVPLDHVGVYVEDIPPVFVAATAFALHNFSALPTAQLGLTLDALHVQAHISLYKAAARNAPSLAVDFNGTNSIKPFENALKFAHGFHQKERTWESPALLRLNRLNNNRPADSEHPPQLGIKFLIKILAFNRATSLQRLLHSLQHAEYGDQRGVDLEIHIDGPRRSEDVSAISATRKIADAFKWEVGSKRSAVTASAHPALPTLIVSATAAVFVMCSVIVREANVGLLEQWLTVWQPRSSDEVALILEDDLEMSPMFFIWLRRAVIDYYQNNGQQRQLHESLENIVEQLIDSNADSMGNNAALRDLYGLPIIYGICLQKQTMMPLHHHAKLSITNGYRPFLYSTIGSWGPLFFPQLWRAFIAWVQWMRRQHKVPLTDHLIFNYFWQRNPRIWTPWMIRFSYEFGVKCLYPNLPGNLSFVVNHREAGENYDVAVGPHARLLTTAMWIDAMTTSAAHRKRFVESYRIDLFDLRWSLLYLPPLRELARWQFDFSVHRNAIIGVDGVLPTYDGGRDGMRSEYVDNWFRFVRNSVQWHKETMRVFYSEQLNGSQGVPMISLHHWIEIMNMLESYLRSNSRILHVELNPLMVLLPTVLQPESQLLTSSAELVKRWSIVLEQIPIWNDFHLSVPCLGLDDENPAGMRDLSSFQAVIAYLALTSSAGVIALQEIISSGEREVEYLLIIDICSTAPSELFFHINAKRSAGLSVSAEEAVSPMRFIAVHKLCESEPHDSGAVLYREDSHFPDRFLNDAVAVVRRFTPTMISERLEGRIDNRLF